MNNIRFSCWLTVYFVVAAFYSNSFTFICLCVCVCVSMVYFVIHYYFAISEKIVNDSQYFINKDLPVSVIHI